ncbi:MAG: hypothetical protein ACU0AU_13950 [Cognatishimia activa]
MGKNFPYLFFVNRESVKSLFYKDKMPLLCDAPTISPLFMFWQIGEPKKHEIGGGYKSLFSMNKMEPSGLEIANSPLFPPYFENLVSGNPANRTQVHEIKGENDLSTGEPKGNRHSRFQSNFCPALTI